MSEIERLNALTGFDQEGIPAEEWRERYYRCAERADRATEAAIRYREALERIAQRHDVNVNGEYMLRDRPALDALSACQVAEEAVKSRPIDTCGMRVKRL